MIELKNITKTFETGKNEENVHAVKNVSLHVDKGDVYGVIGFSGAGKSTLVRCINLLERPTSGDVIIDGTDIQKLNAKDLRKVRREIGMIFQHFNLMTSRTVGGNIAYPLKGSGSSKQAIKQRVRELLKLVELEDKENAYPSTLSGGQKQRVAIARALANNPKILLCDEATSALDPQTTQSILKLLKNISEQLDLTIVLITHEMAVVKAICNKVAVMENGEIVERGDIVEVFAHPKEAITKNFINTTSSINQVYELIENNDEMVRCTSNEQLYRLNYVGDSAEDALISKISVEYKVNVSIIFGNVEVINGVPIGSLVIKISGEAAKVKAAMEYIVSQGIEVEVLKNA